MGGVLNQRLGWPWIFWFLAISAGLCLTGILIFLPETCRSIVGDGSIDPPLLNRLPFPPAVPKQQRQGSRLLDGRAGRRCPFPNPCTSVAVLKQRGTAAIVVCIGVLYMLYSCLQVSLSSLFITIYGVTDLQAGLVYLPFGLSCSVGAVVGGR